MLPMLNEGNVPGWANLNNRKVNAKIFRCTPLFKDKK
jgi:hypothetical protein